VMHTRFIPVGRSGKRENHPEDFMAFAQSIVNPWQLRPFSDRVRQIAIEVKTASV